MAKHLARSNHGQQNYGAPIPAVSLAAVEKEVGFLLATDFQPGVKGEKNLILAFFAAKRSVEKKTRQEATLDAILQNGYFRKRLRELLADKMFQGASIVNFPLPAGDSRSALFEACVKRAHEALPPDLKVKVPTLKIRFVGLAPGERQAHHPALLPPDKVNGGEKTK